MKQLILQFQKFYPHYLEAHSDPINRRFHFTGATLFFTFLFLFLAFFKVWLLLTAVFLGYFLPHIGHTRFQKNESMRISHPIFCVAGAICLYFQTWDKIIKSGIR